MSLNRTVITDAGLAALQDLTTLEHLLRDLRGLQRLDLSNTSITGVGLAHLRTLVALRFLNLSGTRSGDTGLVQLRDLAALAVNWPRVRELSR